MLLSFVSAALLLFAQGASRVPQGVVYTIEASLDEGSAVLTGRGELRYTNNAAVALDTIWMHQHLNAFRPNSAWAQRELEFGNRRFQDLGPDEHAFDRFSRVEIDGRRVAPVYPGAPDSTVVALPLATPLAPGGTLVVSFDWTARPSTLPRRQGRSDRRFDFAQWYPRIAAYDGGGWQTQALLPQGEFYGEFGTYDVTLEVAGDQVIGATGVPVEGNAGFTPVLRQSNAYSAEEPESLGLLAAAPPAGRKHVRYRAERVHHFAWSANPEYVYEGGRLQRPGGGEISIHVLYLPADSSWRNVAVERTIRALDWLQNMFGPYPWPQLTNLHRIETGGTEFPMVVMNGSASEGLIVHEVAHQYVHGIFANNEFDEGWLDEGFSSFLTNWYFEEHGDAGVWEASLSSIRQLEQRGQTQPVATPGADFADPGVYSAMTYTKAELIFRMLRGLIGDETMRTVLHTFYERYALKQVAEADFRDVVNEVTGENFDWFFDQWLHSTAQLDYAIESASTTQLPDGSWRTQVEVVRNGDAWMPVTLQIGAMAGELTWQGRRQEVEITTPDRPAEATLDPQNLLIDIDVANNSRRIEGR
jgi:hypothetical protein